MTDLALDAAGALAATCLGSAEAGLLDGPFREGAEPFVLDLKSTGEGLPACLDFWDPKAGCLGDAATRSFTADFGAKPDLATAAGKDSLTALLACLTTGKLVLAQELARQAAWLAVLMLLLGLRLPPELAAALSAVLSFEALAAVLGFESGALLAAAGAFGGWESLLRFAAGGAESA